jgi:hypothetical protein
VLQDALVRTVLSTQPRTVVVVHSPGAVLMPWADSAPAILFPMVPGQADGAAIAVRAMPCPAPERPPAYHTHHV